METWRRRRIWRSQQVSNGGRKVYIGKTLFLCMLGLGDSPQLGYLKGTRGVKVTTLSSQSMLNIDDMIVVDNEVENQMLRERLETSFRILKYILEIKVAQSRNIIFISQRKENTSLIFLERQSCQTVNHNHLQCPWSRIIGQEAKESPNILKASMCNVVKLENHNRIEKGDKNS